MDILQKYNIDLNQITVDEARELYKFLYQKTWRAKQVVNLDHKKPVGRPKQFSEEEMRERIRQKKAEYRKRQQKPIIV